MNNANRQIRSGATHDVHAPNFHALKRYDRHKTRIEIRMRIAAENALNRSVTDSWADINRETERKKRIAKIRESFERTKTVAEPSNVPDEPPATGDSRTPKDL